MPVMATHGFQALARPSSDVEPWGHGPMPAAAVAQEPRVLAKVADRTTCRVRMSAQTMWPPRRGGRVWGMQTRSQPDRMGPGAEGLAPRQQRDVRSEQVGAQFVGLKASWGVDGRVGAGGGGGVCGQP